MRIPPDLTALLIKIKDLAFEFGPILVIAITLIATFLTLVDTRGLLTTTTVKLSSPEGKGKGKEKEKGKDWRNWIVAYLQAGTPDREKLKTLYEYGWPPPPPKYPAGAGKLILEAGAISVSVGTILAATLLSPVLGLVRFAGGSLFFLIGRLVDDHERAKPVEGKESGETPGISKGSARNLSSSKEPDLRTTTFEKKGVSEKAKIKKLNEGYSATFLGRFWQWWNREFDFYMGRTIFNFLLAALVTIFVPLRLVESWFGAGQWTGPLLVPVVGLLLRPGAPGSETALALALFIKGAGTGSGAAALLAFPLINLIGLAQRWQYYGFKSTLKYSAVAWLVASGIGVLLEISGINANV